MTTADLPDGAHDFDFFHGSWRVDNHRLRSRLTGSDDWETFSARSDCHPILGGIGNVDDIRPEGEGRAGFEGATVRIFDRHTGLWALHWMDNVRCRMFEPVYGRFVDGVGEFDGEDVEGDTPVRVRFRWSGITPTAATWEQAFSADDGVTWETNWVMTFTRIG